MKKEWQAPAVEELAVSETANNVKVYQDSDGIYAGDLGEGSPPGYICTDPCS